MHVVTFVGEESGKRPEGILELQKQVIVMNHHDKEEQRNIRNMSMNMTKNLQRKLMSAQYTSFQA